MVTASDLRRGQQTVANAAANDLSAVWRQVTSAAEARVALGDILPALIRTYGQAAATLAADWYDEARRTAKVPGSFTAFPVDLGDQGAQALAGWATTVGGDSTDNILTLVTGGMTRRVIDWSRATVSASAVADPKAAGWQRVGVGECAFCALLIGRGTVYSEASADFASHDGCRCAAVPAFNGRPRPVKPYAPTDRNITDADRARIREYLRTH